MVQYVVTPWRDRGELLKVRQAFYPGRSAESSGGLDKSRAVALVSVWVQRGNCPHLIESTAILVSAIINDVIGNSAYAMRAAYSAAFCRFVTGLLDGYQDKRHKMSMYSIAKNISLPATFVELRHQCTHEELPSLSMLRAAAKRSLQWIWEHYWQTMETSLAPVDVDECRNAIRDYLRWRASGHVQNEKQRREHAARVAKFETGMILDVLMEFGDSDDVPLMLQSTRLASSILNGEENHESFLALEHEAAEEDGVDSLEAIRTEMARTAEALESNVGNATDSHQHKDQDEEMGSEDDGPGSGWTMWKGPWVPKPIGST